MLTAPPNRMSTWIKLKFRSLSLSSFRPVCPPVTSSSQSVIRSFPLWVLCCYFSHQIIAVVPIKQPTNSLVQTTELTPEPFCHLKCGQSDQPPDQGSSFARHSLNSSSTHAILRRVVQCMQKFRRCTNQITYRVQLLYNNSPSSRRNSFQSPSVLA